MTLENVLLLERLQGQWGECRSSEDGDIVHEVAVVEIKSFAVLESVCKLRLRISTSTVDQHLSDQNVRKSRRLTLPTPSLVVLSLLSSIYPPPLRQSQRCMLEHASRQSSSLRHRCPITPSPTSSANTSLLDRIPRASNVLPARIATPLHGMHLPCHIGLVQLLLVRPRHASSKI